jgi:hypothetical protein
MWRWRGAVRSRAVTTSGTEPGDFVDLDMDTMKVDRRLRLIGLVQSVQGDLESEIGGTLEIVAAGDTVELHDGSGLRFTASLGADGRVVLTDERLGDLL